MSSTKITKLILLFLALGGLQTGPEDDGAPGLFVGGSFPLDPNSVISDSTFESASPVVALHRRTVEPDRSDGVFADEVDGVLHGGAGAEDFGDAEVV